MSTLGGAVREFTELVMQAQGTLDARLAEYLEHHAAPALLPTVGVSAADAPAATTGNPMLDQMQRQLAELSKQMAHLSGGTAGMAAAPSAAEASAAQPAAPGEFKAFGPYKPITRGPAGGLTEHQQRWLDAFIVRYTATVNAKNIYGGYTGEKQATCYANEQETKIVRGFVSE